MPHRICGSIYLFITCVSEDRDGNHVHRYLPYLSGSSTLLFVLLSAPCIINHTLRTQRAHLSATPYSILPKFSATASRNLSRTYTWDKRPKILKFTWTITHLSGHSPHEGQSLKGRALTSKSNAWGMEEEITACVNAETPLMSDPTSWPGLAFTSSPLITLLSLKIWVRMIRFQPKKSTACAYCVQTTVHRLNCRRAGAPTFSSLLPSDSQSLKRESQRKSSWKEPLEVSSSSFCPKQG